ncbi:MULTISPECIES: carbohydrate ABC transporter permease [Frigoribacterium]|jgi:alpha-glucoside transport system permease protein|uniref:carbohydrate ABC transporter permease n=1 Tax=Frigoribacterium TaxID=96492 RepID=UPI0006F67529|nr:MULTISPECIES: carbohydrate ABC transporter permease [Frigoribacterium]KQR44655.1 sugar ABC transporter permease [Frigoribacterium sp. Leaf164]MBD8661342.1 carbohydrate ABC transporter permease [Frigoribacterium sp. CFBP 8754]MBD8729187.1 carbohydrate ABC transporter permease [Frigoribacterium sp. CFBP 13707]NII52480.1 alpha-glucoside transport system permease protein [Frigoribacterium endophyticum]QNE44092.1 carbohydrate ABC transporter permease [Frigoribacterium sp. NBH87]
MTATPTPVGVAVPPRTESQLKRGVAKIENSSGKLKKGTTSRGATIAALIIAVIWTLPTAGLFISSFRPATDIKTTGWWTVFANPGFTLDNYVNALNSGDSLTLGKAFLNSLVITLPAALIPITIASLAAYAFAWIDFKGRNTMFVLVFALQIVPIQMALVPLLRLFSDGLVIGGLYILPGLGVNGLDGSFAKVWIAHTIFALPLAIFMLHNFISEIPAEVIEAARMDGAGHGQVFFRIVLPLSMPAIASFGIFQFLWVWNDLLVATVFTSGEGLPITKALQDLSGSYGQSWELLTAGAFISIIVPLIVFFALQRFFVRGLLAGATKG